MKATADRQSRRLSVRLTEREYDNFLKAKQISGLSLSAMMRQTINFYAFTNLTPATDGKPDNNDPRRT